MRTWPSFGLAALLGCVFVGVLQLSGLDERSRLVFSDGSQLLVAVVAAVGCLTAARASSAQRRSAWRWLAAGCASWAAGQLVWSVHEVLLGREAPFPSLADVGFLLFPVLAGVGLVRWLGTQQHQLVARSRDVLDGAILAGSLLVVSWVTTLGSVLDTAAGSWLPLALSLAYPAGDLVLATLVLLALSRSGRAERATLVLLALGLGALATADSVYVYLVGTGAYTSADLITVGWVLGFACVAAAGFGVGARRATGGEDEQALDHDLRRSLLQLLLPYLALLVAAGALAASLLTGGSGSPGTLALSLVLVVVVVARQLLELLDNQRLLTALAQARDALESQALHDALTGLANRTLFADRLDQALRRPGSEVSVLFCDVDDLKIVNDSHGHDVGDALLVQLAARLRGCVRDADTVARLSGDEFAVLLVDTDDAVRVAERIVARVAAPMVALERHLSPSVSVGIAHQADATGDQRGRRGSGHGASTPGTAAQAAALLQRADQAMYAAKLAGKGQTAVAEPGVAPGARELTLAQVRTGGRGQRGLSDPA